MKTSHQIPVLVLSLVLGSCIGQPKAEYVPETVSAKRTTPRELAESWPYEYVLDAPYINIESLDYETLAAQIPPSGIEVTSGLQSKTDEYPVSVEVAVKFPLIVDRMGKVINTADTAASFEVRLFDKPKLPTSVPRVLKFKILGLRELFFNENGNFKSPKGTDSPSGFSFTLPEGVTNLDAGVDAETDPRNLISMAGDFSIVPHEINIGPNGGYNDPYFFWTVTSEFLLIDGHQRIIGQFQIDGAVLRGHSIQKK